ncbi:hypothetical protein Hanom_Chr05g00432271 [Helianthus anomalus]
MYYNSISIFPPSNDQKIIIKLIRRKRNLISVCETIIKLIKDKKRNLINVCETIDMNVWWVWG